MSESTISTSQPPGDLYCPSCERNFREGAHCPEDGTRLVRIQTAVDPLLGRNLDGRYTITEKLGQGGMGAVYRGTQHSVGREIAIKVISAHLVADRDAIKRFLREAKLASRLSHPNAVSVLEFGQTDDGLLYLVMELVTGRTLDQVIKREGVLKPERIVRIGMQVCDALEGAHALQIVHRDLKPANIMLLAQGRDLVKVLDFGLAKSVAPDQASTTMTNAGALLGTPAFMPPELALGQPCDARADLYSLGVILYLLGVGRLPFTSESAHELIAMHGHEPAPPMTNVPPALAAVVDQLLEKSPAKRFQTAADTREALEASLGARMVTPSPFAGGDTSPSLGPFPATASQYANLDTPAPRRSSSELHRIVSSDTIAVSTAPTTSSMVTRPSARRRWVAPVIALLAAGAVGTGVFVAMTRGTDDANPAPSVAPEPETAPVIAPTPAPPPPPVMPPVTPPAAADSPPPPTSATSEPAPKPDVAETRPAPKPAKPRTRPTKPRSKPSATKPPPTVFKPPTSGINPTTTPPVKPPPATGSAAPAKGLPF